MTHPSSRLSPPAFALDDDIRWVLLAAFATKYPQQARPASAERAAQLVRQFSLVSQVTTRLTREELAQALTPPYQSQHSDLARRRLMRSIAVSQTRERVCAIANEVGIDVALLKQAALEVLKLAGPGQRYATDVDLLVKPDDVSRLASVLERAGFTPESRKRHVDGVVVVRNGDGIGVELHTRLVNLRMGLDHAVPDFKSLEQCGALVQSDVEPSRVWLPSLAVIGAQLCAQGWYLFHFVPHAPQHKSPIRVIVDLGLLGVHRDEALAAQVHRLIEHDVPAEEFWGLVQLVGHLGRGEVDHLLEHADTALRHAIAAMTSNEYRDSLMLERQRDAVQREGAVGWVTRNFRRAFFPSSDEVDRWIAGGKARNRVEARLRIVWRLAADGLRGTWIGIGRRDQ